MSDTIQCDICRRTPGLLVDRADFYRIDRPTGDVVDVCSPECLSTLAIGEAREQSEHEAELRYLATPQPQPTRKHWWQR